MDREGRQALTQGSEGLQRQAVDPTGTRQGRELHSTRIPRTFTLVVPALRQSTHSPAGSRCPGHLHCQDIRLTTDSLATCSSCHPAMETASVRAQQLRAQIAKAEEELKSLKEQLAQAEAQETEAAAIAGNINGSVWKWPLQAEEYDRYGRQLILPNVGIQGQITSNSIIVENPLLTYFPGQQRLKASKILIVGAGGLGCPAAAYIAGAGVGTLGIVDGDVVEPSNLHRQIAHGTSRVGMLKVDSLVAYCKEWVAHFLST